MLLASLLGAAGCLLTTDTTVNYPSGSEDTGSSDLGGSDTGSTDTAVRDTRPDDTHSEEECDDFCENYEVLNECAARPSRPCPEAACSRVSEACRDCIAEAECGAAHFCEPACGRFYCSTFFPEECEEADAGFPDLFEDTFEEDAFQEDAFGPEPYPGVCDDLADCCAEYTPAFGSAECFLAMADAGENERACAEALWEFEIADNCDINPDW